MKKNYDPITEDRKENINLFKHIIEPEKYSKYSNQLNKVFSSNSYSKFFNDLTKIDIKKPITLKDKINNWLNISSKSTKFNNQNFDANKFKSKLKEMEEKEILFYEKRKKNTDKRTIKRKLLSQLTANKIIKIKSKRNLINKPCIGVYNPKYESIGKHTYGVTFGKNFDDFNNDENNKKINFKKINNFFSKKSKTIDNNFKYNKKVSNFEKKVNKTVTQFKIGHINTNNLKSKSILSYNFKKKENTSLSPKIIENNKKINIKRFNTDDELLFFPKLKRKKRNKSNNENNIISNSFKNTLSNQSTLNKNINLTFKDSCSYRRIKGNVNFDKISTNKNIGSYFEEITKKNKSPAVGIYHPCYSSVFARTTNIFFPNKKSKNGRKKLLYKIITNYNQNVKYELFNILNKEDINKN